MGAKRGKLAGSFVGDTKAQTLDFYRKVVQTLRPWIAPAPKLSSSSNDNHSPIDEASSGELAARLPSD